MMDIEALMPADTPRYMAGAWLGCLSWAISTPEVVAAFRAETGLQWRPGTTPLERMIDEATGADHQFIVAFVNWVNREVWGPLDADSLVRAIENPHSLTSCRARTR